MASSHAHATFASKAKKASPHTRTHTERTHALAQKRTRTAQKGLESVDFAQVDGDAAADAHTPQRGRRLRQRSGPLRGQLVRLKLARRKIRGSGGKRKHGRREDAVLTSNE
eukprot:2158356-Pleurochrysis_carterae.AAC.3